MRFGYGNGRRFQGSVLGVLVLMLVASSGFAEQPNPRDDMTGEQLFEHEWQWTGPASQPRRLDPKKQKLLLEVLSGRLTRAEAVEELELTGDGLGPLFNANSCAACHRGGGGAGVQHNVTLLTIDPRLEGARSRTIDGDELVALFPGAVGGNGLLNFNVVVHDQSTRPGYDAIRAGLSKHVPDGIDDGWFVPRKRNVQAIAKQPVVAGRVGHVDFYLSQRNSPALFGLGIIDRISSDRLRHLAKRQARVSEGKITGRFVGKFGWRGQVQSLTQFVEGACSAELGLNLIRTASTSSPQAGDPADPAYANLASDMTRSELLRLTNYVNTLPRPIERRPDGATIGEVLDGEATFNKVGCVACHVADIHPVSGAFSDFLLHDMGPGLQAPSPAPAGDLRVVTFNAPRVVTTSSAATNIRNATASARGVLRASGGASYYSGPIQTFPVPYPIVRPEEPQFPRGEIPEIEQLQNGKLTNWDMLQREWRTPPLWGVADTAPYLHDGRAATLEEAIEWHGGEAASSRDRFAKLSRADKDLVLKFLSSLKAPTP